MRQQIIARGASANDGTGSTARAAGKIINDNFAEISRIAADMRPIRIGFLGNSISERTGGVGFDSWLFWAMALKPRNITLAANLGKSGRRSGPSYNATTGAIDTSAFTATDGEDMNTPAMKAACLAANVDDWYFEANHNDGGLYDSFRNNVEMVDWLRANGAGKRFIFYSAIMPRAATQSYTPELHALMRRWADETPDVFFLETAHLLVDDKTGYVPLSTGAPYGKILDSIGHVGPAGARDIGIYMNKFWDSIPGYTLRNIREVYTLDAWDAVNHPGGNILKTAGTFTGASNNAAPWIGNNASGVVPPGVAISTSNAELTAVASRPSDFVLDGVPHSCLRIDITAASTLTARRNLSVFMGPPGSASIAASHWDKTKPIRRQLVVKCDGVKDLCGIRMMSTADGSGVSARFGSAGLAGSDLAGVAGPNPAVAPVLNDTLYLAYINEADLSSSTGGFSNLLEFHFMQGLAAGAAGSITLCMHGVWPKIDYPLAGWAGPTIPAFP